MRLRLSSLRTLFRLTPFTAGCGMVVVLVLLYLADLPLLHRTLRSFDQRVIDYFFQVRGAVAPSERIVIVDIDEASLKRLGQWPWPRTVMGNLIGRVCDAEPAVIGMDVIFPEKDRTSPVNFLPLFEEAVGHDIELGEQGRDNDALFGDAIAECGRVVLGYLFILNDDGLPPGPQRPFPMCNIRYMPPRDQVNYQFFRTYRPLLNVDAIAAGCRSEGFVNTIPDEDGVIRRVPLFMEYDGISYPSLSAEMVRENRGADTYVLRSSENGILGVFLGDRFLPTDHRCQMAVNWRGPDHTFEYVSAVDVLDGKVPAAKLHDAYILLGSSAAALHDLRVTPYGVTPGVEVHANVIDNIMEGDMLRHDLGEDVAMAVTFVSVGGVLLSLLVSRSSALKCALAGVVLLVLAVGGGYVLFHVGHRLVGLTFPVVATVLIFLVVSLFNYFTEGREKQFIRHAFSHYVSEDVVATMVRDPSRLSLQGEERDLSVLFCDIRGFTGISESMSAPELSQFLNEYLTAMTDIIMATGGTVDKFIGDAIVAIWGAPLDDPEHPNHAVSAALQMNDGLRGLRKRWIEQGRPAVFTGFGINSGRMNVGNMGSRTRFDYTVIGDNVNLASRLEGLNKVYGTSILCSDTTRQATGHGFTWRLVDRVTVKGRLQPVRIYEPLHAGLPTHEELTENQRYEAALEAMWNRDFAAAHDQLDRLCELRNDAPVYEFHLKQAEQFLETPPPQDWNGVTEHHEK